MARVSIAASGARPRVPRVALVLALLIVFIPAPAQAAPGWKLLWSDDFNGSDIPDKCARYGGAYDGGDSFWVSEEARVSGGLLRLGIRAGERAGKHYLSGGVTCYKLEIKYGKFEWRAKVPKGKGIDSYATLWPEQDLPNQAALFEFLGVPGKEQLSITNEYGSGKTGGDVYGSYTDSFHTYTVEWTPTRFRLLIDGVQKYTSNRVCTVKRSIGFAVSNGDNFTGVPDASTQLPAEFQIDWVRVYAYVANAPAPTTTARPSSPPPATTPATPSAGTTSAPPAAASDGSVPSPEETLSNTANSQESSVAWAWWGLGLLVLLVVGGAVRTLWNRYAQRHR